MPDEFLLRFKIDLSQADAELKKFSARANAEIAKSLNIAPSQVPTSTPIAPREVGGQVVSPAQLGNVVGVQQRLAAREFGVASGKPGLTFGQLDPKVQQLTNENILKNLGINQSYKDLTGSLGKRGELENFTKGVTSGNIAASAALKKGTEAQQRITSYLEGKGVFDRESLALAEAQRAAEAEELAATKAATASKKKKATKAEAANARTDELRDPVTINAKTAEALAKQNQKLTTLQNPQYASNEEDIAIQNGILKAKRQQARSEAYKAEMAQQAATHDGAYYKRVGELEAQLIADTKLQVAATNKALQARVVAQPSFAKNVGEGEAAAQLTEARFGAERANYFAQNPDKRDQLVSDDVTQKREAAIQKGKVDAQLSVDKDYLAGKAESAAATKREAVITEASVNEKLAIDKEYQASLLANIKANQVARLEQIKATESQDILRTGELAAEEKVLATKVRVAELQSTSTAELIPLQAEEMVLRRTYNKELKQAVAQKLKENGDRFGAWSVTHGRGGVTGQGPQDLGGAFGQGAFSSLTHILPSLALFAAAGGIVSSVKAAQDLEIKLGQIQEQLKAVGQSDSFGHVKDEILSVAKETGIASDKVANIRYQLQGSLGGQDASGKPVSLGGQTGQDLVDNETKSVAKLTALTGWDPQQVIDNVTAVGLAFNATGDQIGNVAFQIENNFGVRVQETMGFLGDIAPVAKQAGFSLEEFATIAAVAQKRSGQSGSAIAEKFARVIEGITSKKKDLIDIIQGSDKLSQNGKLLEDVGKNDTRDLIFQLAKVYDQLDKGTQDKLTGVFGGARNFQAILPAFQEGNLEESVGKLDRNADTLDVRFRKLQESVGQQLKELVESLKQIGIAIYNGGLQEALSIIIDSLKLLAFVVTPLVKVLGSFASAWDGLPVKILAAYAAFRLLSGPLGSLGGAIGNVRFPTALRAVDRGITLPGEAVASQSLAYRAGTTPLAQKAFAPASTGAMIGIGLVGAAAVFQAYQSKKADVDKAQNDLKEVLSKATEEKVKNLAEQHSSFFDYFAAHIFGDKTPEELASAELANRSSSRAQKYLVGAAATNNDKALQTAFQDVVNRYRWSPGGLSLDSGDQREALNKYQLSAPGGKFDPSQVTGDKLKTLAEDANAGQGEAANLAIKLSGFFGEAEFQQILRDAGVNIDAVNAIAEADTTISNARKSIDQAEADVKSGRGTLINLMRVEQQNLAELDAAIAAAEKDGKGNDPSVMELKKARDDLRGKISESALTEVASNDSVQDYNVTALGADPKVALAAAKSKLQSRLTAVQSGKLNPDDQRKTVKELVDLQKQIIETTANQFSSSGEAIAYLQNNSVLPPDVQAEVINAQLGNLNTTWTTLLESFKQVYGDSADVIIKQLFSDVVHGVKTVEEARGEIQGKIDTIILASAISGVAQPGQQQQIDALNKLKAAFPDTGVDLSALGGSPDTYHLDTNKKAQKQFSDAQFDYQKALVADNPVAAANVEVQKARSDLALAEGQQETQAAQTALVTAQHSQRQAMLAIIKAQNNYALALVSQNPVAAAAQEIANAQTDLQIALQNQDQAGVYNAQAAIVKAQQSAVDASYAVAQAQVEYNASFSQDPAVAAQAAIQKADLAYQQAVAHGDAAAQYQALADKNKALQQQEVDLNAIIDAKAAYAAALVEGDPVRAAQTAIEAASRKIANAHGEAEKYQALAEKVKADRALTDAVRAVYDAQANVASALADFNGDSVQAAQLKYQAALTALQRAKEDAASGAAGQAAVKNAEAEVINAQAGLRDARIKKQEDDYAFQYEMGQITKSQYIQYLEGLKSLAGGNQTIIRDLDRQIKQLKDQLGADTQFNLPTNIGLPTLYEARRLAQSGPYGSGGYQDNRQISITMTVTDGMSAAQAQQVITDALGVNDRFGTIPRRY